MKRKTVPQEWATQQASTCFAKAHNGEGSYYCPDCGRNCGSVWLGEEWRPTKLAALMECCVNKYKKASVDESIAKAGQQS